MEKMTPQKLVDQILEAAERERASDVHIEPGKDDVIIKFRIDGILREVKRFKIHMLENLVSHLKVLGQLDITIHSTPQEGSFEWLGKIKDENDQMRFLSIRVSIFPTINGEAIVLRILNRSELLMSVSQLGFDKHDEQLINKLIISPYGMILASGPANSGKTTLLYSMLKEIAAPEKNIVALEDPVEYNLEFVRQSQINPARNFTYEAGLRSILRQDPDVIMIGEIRDRQTAENAIHISLTGRLLLTTIHANNSVGTVARLLDIKVSPPLIAYSVNGIIAQRLARRICNNCKITHPPESVKLEMLGIRPNSMPFFKGKGCDECLNTGYYGRVGIFEILVIDDEFRKTIVGHESIEELITLAEKKGLKTLRQDGIQKMKDGITTIEEVLRLGI